MKFSHQFITHSIDYIYSLFVNLPVNIFVPTYGRIVKSVGGLWKLF